MAERKDNPQRGKFRYPSRKHDPFKLRRVLKNKPLCCMGDLIDRTEGPTKIDSPMHCGLTIEATTELFVKILHEIDIGPSKALDSLPIITNCK